MCKFFRLLFFCFSLCACHENWAVAAENANHDFVNMSCSDLMLGLINESSFSKKFHDKRMALEFYFERSNDKYMVLKFVRRAGVDKDGIYGNFKLDLVNRTLKFIDPSPPVPIKINKDYIPFIAKKCTPDQNLYGNTGHLPDPVYDGGG